MRFSLIILVTIFVSGCTISEPELVQEQPELKKIQKKMKNEKVIVCHETGSGTYKKIEISKSALDVHLMHGDALPGEDVPGMPGYIFTEDCDCEKIIPTEGLVAHYPFNGNAEDESDYDNNGLINEANLVEDRYGDENSAFHFDGINDYISCPEMPQIILKEKISIQAWVKPETLSGPFFGLVDKYEYGGYYLAIRYINDSYKFDFGLNVTGVGTSVTKLLSSTSVTVNTLYHVVATYDGIDMKIYINGVLENLINIPSEIYYRSDYSSFPLGIGAALAPTSAVYNYYFNGVIDEVRIYNRALTEDEIRLLFNE